MFKQWVSVDIHIGNIQQVEFVDMFCEKIELLCPHYFIARQQAELYKDRKLHLMPGEMLVCIEITTTGLSHHTYHITSYSICHDPLGIPGQNF